MKYSAVPSYDPYPYKVIKSPLTEWHIYLSAWAVGGKWTLSNAAWSTGGNDTESPCISFIMDGGYTHPQRDPLTQQWACIIVVSKKSDPFDYLQSPLLKLFFINGL